MCVFIYILMYELGLLTSLTGNSVQDICTKNASIALSHDRLDLVQAWTTISLIANESMEVPKDPDDGMPWAMHPFGRQLLQSL